MKHLTVIRRWGTGICLSAALGALPLASLRATPVIDGAIDAEYTKIASSLPDNLNTNGLDVNNQPFNDETDPVAKALDVTNLWAANTASDLYIFIEMPSLDLNVISGEWALAFHLGGANDTYQRLGVVGDPYGAPIQYDYAPGVNAVLKSNMAGLEHTEPNNVGFDGNQGYAFLNSINHAQNDWTWDTGEFLTNKTWIDDTANHLIHATGSSGGEIVYKGGKGIEVKIPLALFGANPSNTPITAPKIGDVIKMQFYDNVRYYPAGDVVKYPRGPSDAVPFEDGVYKEDSLKGYLSQMATYTMKAPTAMEVSGFSTMQNPTDTSHLAVTFSAPLGDGATTAGNYNLVNTDTGAAVPIDSVAIDPTNSARALLSLNLPFNTNLRVTVSNIKSDAGVLVSSAKNTAETNVGTGVVFNLHDPYGLIARIGNDPKTGEPYTITIPGDHNGWDNSPTSVKPVIMVPVSGESGHWRSPVVLVKAGLNGYKYSQPGLPNWDNWNALNPYDRRAVILPSSSIVEVNDNAAGTYDGSTTAGPPVAITFTLVDLDNKVNGGEVYLTGEFNGWSESPGSALKMDPVAGKPNTYSVTWTTPANFGQDITHKYKYLRMNPDTFTMDWNILNPNGEWGGDHHIITKGSGTPLTQNAEDIVGPRSLRIGRIASGMSQAPGLAGYWRELDPDLSGQISLLDLLRVIRP